MDQPLSPALAAYRDLERRFARLAAIEDSLAILHWDMAAMMPKGGAESRAEQLAVLKSLAHEILTRPDMGELLDRACEAALSDWERANLSEMKRVWRHATAVPADLVEALSRAASACEMAWREARPAADFARVRPALAELLALVRAEAAAKSAALGLAPYDALMDQYEPGVGAAEVDPLFADLEKFLPGILGRALESQAGRPSPLPLEGPFPIGKQKELGLRMMTTLGFDFDGGRLDVSLHPFCGGTPADVRLTTRYDEADFFRALMGVLHETGHALYEQGLPRAWLSQPVGKARSMAIHESQSLLMEMQACRSRAYVEFAAPLMRETFGGSGPAWDADNLYRHAVKVVPGHIRVDADEVTYPCHVILRYRLEKAMVEGDLNVGDLPGAWNEQQKALMGFAPPTDREGCLQDIHWYDGAFGYFPCYTLGAMTAAQLFEAAKSEKPEIPARIALGDFAPLRDWLRTHVHGRGSSLPTRDLLTAATGRPLDPNAFKKHLESRYL